LLKQKFSMKIKPFLPKIKNFRQKSIFKNQISVLKIKLFSKIFCTNNTSYTLFSPAKKILRAVSVCRTETCSPLSCRFWLLPKAKQFPTLSSMALTNAGQRLHRPFSKNIHKLKRAELQKLATKLHKKSNASGFLNFYALKLYKALRLKKH